MSSAFTAPNCGVQAPEGAWATDVQLEYAKEVALGHVADQFGNELLKLDQPGSGLTFERSKRSPSPPEPPIEPDDMRRVDFDCHPNDPLKILDDWGKPVYCLICGTMS